MDWLEFLASVIGSLAWPAAIAFIVYLLREPIRKVIPGLRKFGFAGLEAEFGERVQEAAVMAASTQTLADVTPGTALVTELGPEIATAPRAAVIEAWLAVERELEALAERVDIDRRADHRWTPAPLVRELVGQEVLDPITASVILDLRNARNLAAHDQSFELEHDEVVNYVKLAGRVSAALRAARRNGPATGSGGRAAEEAPEDGEAKAEKAPEGGRAEVGPGGMIATTPLTDRRKPKEPPEPE
jgi:hypothetical protein